MTRRSGQWNAENRDESGSCFGIAIISSPTQQTKTNETRGHQLAATNGSESFFVAVHMISRSPFRLHPELSVVTASPVVVGIRALAIATGISYQRGRMVTVRAYP
jgi:hypothetical protein